MMSNIFHSKFRIFLLIGGMVLCIYGISQGVLFAENTFVVGGINALRNEATCLRGHTPLSTDEALQLQRPDFQTGVVYIQWGLDGYGRCNAQWQTALDDIHTQMGARWLELPITFNQVSQTTTHLTLLPTTPSVNSFREGIATAHAMGYSVFVVPLIGISSGTGRWSGAIHFTNTAMEQQWFDNYWQIYRPYVEAAAQAGANQLSIGTEDEWLERNVPASIWEHYIAQVRSIFPGTLTYDMNWSDITQPIPSWLASSNINMVGVSEYIPLTDKREDTVSGNITALWHQRVQVGIDAFAARIKKPIFLSEIGYRNTKDALFNPWEQVTASPHSAQLQSTACDAALTNILADPNIHGVYFWSWENVNLFNLHNSPAVSAIHKWYTLSK